jgi:hypothetical protein
MADMPKIGSKEYMLLNREYDGLKPTFKRKERLKGKNSKFYPVFIGRGFSGVAEGGLIVDRQAKGKRVIDRQKRGPGLDVDKRTTPKVGSSNTGRTGRFGTFDYRSK